jgi:hypothetical protein
MTADKLIVRRSAIKVMRWLQWILISMHAIAGSAVARYPTNSSGIDLASVCVLTDKQPRVDPRPASPLLTCSNKDCPRCLGSPSHLCCDTCNPGSFILPVPATIVQRQSHAPNKFKADSCGYSMTEADKKLKDALYDWQIKQLQDLGVANGDDMFGPQLIMTDTA